MDISHFGMSGIGGEICKSIFLEITFRRLDTISINCIGGEDLEAKQQELSGTGHLNIWNMIACIPT